MYKAYLLSLSIVLQNHTKLSDKYMPVLILFWWSSQLGFVVHTCICENGKHSQVGAFCNYNLVFRGAHESPARALLEN